MQRLIDKIRAKYPVPVIFTHHCKAFEQEAKCNHYCVGGAYLQSRGMNYMNFPSTDQLEKFGELPRETVIKIINANDDGNYELAWELLSQAIEPQGKG